MPPEEPSPIILVEGRDYMVDSVGRWIFSGSYLLARGRCCGSGCKNCPYQPPVQPSAATPSIDAPPEHR